MRARRHQRLLGFTLTELTMSMAIGSIVAALSLTYLRVASVLAAKNLSTNFSHNSLHKSLDWMTDRIQGSEYIPVLITSGSGTVLSGSQVIGVYFDRLVGSSYVFPNTSGTITAGATTLTVQYSNNVYASPPAPSLNDVVLVSGATITTGSGASAVTSTLRPRVSSATVTTSGTYQSAAITLSGTFGGAYSWNYSSSGVGTEYQTAMIIHREAFIVMTNTSTGNSELRYYPNFETATTLASSQFVAGSNAISYVTLSGSNLTDLSASSSYQVLTDQVGQIPGQSAPYPPFSETTTAAGAVLVGMDIRVRGTQYDNVLDGNSVNGVSGPTKEAYEFSQFARVITTIPLRQHPTSVFQ